MVFLQDTLTVHVDATRAQMGKRAAEAIAAHIHALLSHKDEINMIFAAAPSQNEVLAALCTDTSIPWQRINAFHMDEYIGLPVAAPQLFSSFLQNAIFGRVGFRSVYCIDSAADPAKECTRYASLLRDHPADIVVMGIGENGHIAFNDPPAAFDTPEWVKIVELDAVCRMQQVHDGCFAQIADVPTHAFTLTVPALTAAGQHFCIVPAATKAWAVERTLHGPIGSDCPATVLRTLPGAMLFCDSDSAALLKSSEGGKAQ